MSTFALPSPSRRTLLAGLAGSAAAAGMFVAFKVPYGPPQRGAARQKFAGRRRPLLEAGLEQWSSEIGSTFYTGTEAGALALKLVAVTALPVVGARPGGLRAQPFEVRFEPVGNRRLPAGDRAYPMRHADYRDFTLFFNHTGDSLKAIFN